MSHFPEGREKRRDQHAARPGSLQQWAEWRGGKTKNLNFNLGLPPRPSHVQINFVGTKLTAAPERGGSTSSSLTPDPVQGLAGHNIQGRVLGEHRGLNNPGQQTPPHNCCTEWGHQGCDRAAQSQEKHFQQHTGNRHWMCCFYKLQQTATFGWEFFLWQTPEICWHWFLCGSRAAYTAAVLRPPSIQRYFLIMGAFCQIHCYSFPLWITTFKLVGFPLASSLLQSQCSPKKAFTEN